MGYILLCHPSKILRQQQQSSKDECEDCGTIQNRFIEALFTSNYLSNIFPSYVKKNATEFGGIFLILFSFLIILIFLFFSYYKINYFFIGKFFSRCPANFTLVQQRTSIYSYPLSLKRPTTYYFLSYGAYKWGDYTSLKCLDVDIHFLFCIVLYLW